jgi:uncharacterized protein (DUF1015 family)
MSPRGIGDPAARRLLTRSYRAVTERLALWQERGQIQQDAVPALYLHEYSSAGLSVRGLVGLLDVSHRSVGAHDRAILPHEGIHPAQADSLADRMTSLGLNPAPILLVHHGSAAVRAIIDQVAGGPPLADFEDRAEQRHRVWAIHDEVLLARIASELASGCALIADGHHRYAAYLRMQAREPGGPADRGLAMLVDQLDTPLYVGPIHRVLLGVTLDDVEAAAVAVAARFSGTDRPTALEALDPHTLVITDGESWGTLKMSLAGDQTAVEALHDTVVPALPRGPSRLKYVHAVADALAETRRAGGVAVLMPAPSVQGLMLAAAANRLLPEKATSFQPKPNAGVLIRRFYRD